MDHPFKISETYENNKGSYTVLDIFPPQMQIEYAHGPKSVVNIDMQARIWDRIQTERAIEEEVRQRKMRTGRLPITFFGLEESDFKENVASTTWRSCEGLGGLVSQQLSDISGNIFQSVAIYRRPQFFVYPPELPMDNQKGGAKLLKFVVQINSEGLSMDFTLKSPTNRWVVIGTGLVFEKCCHSQSGKPI